MVNKEGIERKYNNRIDDKGELDKTQEEEEKRNQKRNKIKKQKQKKRKRKRMKEIRKMMKNRLKI